MRVPEDLFYTKTHEWVKRVPADPMPPSSIPRAAQEPELLVGITAHAQEELRDIVFVELPQVGRIVKRGEPAAVIESVKAAFDIYAPVSGRVTRANGAVSSSPQMINQDCYGSGWLFAIAPADPAEFAALLPSEDYSKQIHATPH